MERVLTLLCATVTVLISQINMAGSAPLFNVSTSGISAETLNITLCLNGNGPLSCQDYDVSSLNLNINTTIPNHSYSSAGIKVNTPGYSLTGCKPIQNGQCLFSVSDTSTAKIFPANALYNVVMDAGSSGTRVYVYQTTATAAAKPLIVNLYEQASPTPLASCGISPDIDSCVALAIQPLLTGATNVLQTYNIPPSQATASLLGTAGMRLLPPDTQASIYAAVDTTIESNDYILGETETITGQEEGLYQWLNVNYLNGSIGSSATSGIIEMGGASTQVAFVTNSTSNPNVIAVTINGLIYDVYSYSFLGLGQNLARTTMNSGPNPDYCYPTGYNSGSIMGDFNFPGCSTNFNTILEQQEYAELSQIASLPGFSSQAYYGIASIYYDLAFLGVLSNPTSTTIPNAINSICYNSYATLQVLYPNAFQLYNSCANSTYANSFLYSGLNFGNNVLFPVLTINNVAITWTLGYVYSVNKTPAILN